MSSPLATAFSPLSFPTARGLARVPPYGYVGKPKRAEEECEGDGPEGNVDAHAASVAQQPFAQSSSS
jgi:hypothetical protein